MSFFARTCLFWIALLLGGCDVKVDQVPGGADLGLDSNDSTMTPADAARSVDGMAVSDAEADHDAAEPSDAGRGADMASVPDVQTAAMDASALNDAESVLDQAVPADTSVSVDLGDADVGEPMQETVDQITRRVLAAHGVSDMRTGIPEMEVLAQAELHGGEVDFETALSGALNSFLTDGRDIESPLSLVSDLRDGPCLDPDNTERVRCFLNRDTALLELFGAEGFSPENGEGIEENWIFILRAESLSDHIQWAIIDRTGARAPFNYGFN